MVSRCDSFHSSLKLVINRDVILYETFMIQVLAPKDSSIKAMQRADKQVEFDIGLVPNSNEQSVPIAFVPVQHYSIAIDRDMRTIKPPRRW